MQRLFVRTEDGFEQRDLSSVDDAEGALWQWLDLFEWSDDEIDDVVARFGLDSATAADLRSDVLFPKIERRFDYAVVVWHNVVATGTRVSTREVDFVFGDRFIVSCHRAPSETLDEVAAACLAEPQLVPRSVDHFLAQIVDYGSRRYLALVDDIDARIEVLEDRALLADPSTIGEVQALRRDALVLRRVIGPQRDVIRHMTTSDVPLTDEGRNAFGDAFDNMFRIVETLDVARSLLASVLDSYRSTVAEKTNNVMQILTIFAAILLPLGLITGIYGMNVAGLPGVESDRTFTWIMGGMAVLAIVLWSYFAWRGFVVGPRLHKLPRATGLVITKVGAVPFRLIGDAVTTVRRTIDDGPSETSPGH